MLKRLARRLGVVRARSLEAVAGELRDARRKITKQTTVIEKLRSEHKQLEKRTVAAEAAATTLNVQLEAEREQFAKAKGDLSSTLQRMTRELETQTRHAQRQIDGEREQRRLRDAERELKTVREYLAVLEGKLDVLDVARNALETRTRLLSVRRVESAGDAGVEPREQRPELAAGREGGAART